MAILICKHCYHPKDGGAEIDKTFIYTFWTSAQDSDAITAAAAANFETKHQTEIGSMATATSNNIARN